MSRHLLDAGKLECASLIISSVPIAFPEISIDETTQSAIQKAVIRATGKGHGELTLPCFVFAKLIKGAPPATAAKIQTALESILAAKPNSIIARTEAAGPYINFFLTSAFLASIIPLINEESAAGGISSYLAPLSSDDKDRVMIEFSQPNSHKAFHVGHMRNVALGDSLVRLYRQMGHPVVAANYYGDEGAHVAKCLWYLKRFLKERPDFDMETVPLQSRGEWLGGMYSSSVGELDLASFTNLPYANIIAAEVLSIEPHPAAEAPANWRKVALNIGGGNDSAVTVICGGIGYKVGDRVAYTPVGSSLGKGKFVEPKDMLGVLSCGVMMVEKELGIAEEKKDEKKEEKPKKEAKPAKKEGEETAAKGKEKEKGAEKKDGEKKKEDKKEPKAKKVAADESTAANQIFILPAEISAGADVIEFGRKSDCNIPKDRKIVDELNQRKKEVKELLLAMEAGESEICELWRRTKEWSLTEFRSIYDWLGCKFDTEFYESEVSEESRLMAREYREKGVFVDSNGAVGADLNSFGLGFCVLLKSDGAGLYATKDLSLAKRKFESFKIDKSIYVVDAAQMLHFKQVFKCLELMGYEQAKKCFHLPYGQVVLPSGRMKSRVFGSVILFSQLKELLGRDVMENFLKKYETGIEIRETENPQGENIKSEVPCEKWSAEDIAAAIRTISVATIRFGMLNHDTAKDIVFILEEWTNRSGVTGPYMLYAYTRIRSIIREASANCTGTADFSLLKHDSERSAMLTLHDFWSIVEGCVQRNNPSTLCEYLFDVSRAFSQWYSNKECSVIRAESEDLKATRIEFIKAIAAVIKRGLELLGINVLEKM